jgi:tetratricopeptide (TPR) repeat protein
LASDLVLSPVESKKRGAMNTKIKLFKPIYRTIMKPSISLLFIAGVCLTFLPAATFAQTSSRVVSGSSNQDDFSKKFREGRDLIDKEEWAKAADKFSEAVAVYPNNKSADAALYWLAYCYKRQKKFKEMEVALDRLLKEFPASSWADDAKVMKMEIPKPRPANRVDQTPPLPNIAALPNIQDLPNVASLPNLFDEPLSFDRETEIKIAAFKSLLFADPKRAIQTMGDILTPDSKASETFKQSVLRILRNANSLETQVRSKISASGGGNQLITLLREALITSFQKESNIKIRKEIIYTLATLNDEQSINYLAQLYGSKSNQEYKEAIINSLLQLVGSWAKPSDKVIDAFARLYDAETDEQFKLLIIQILSDSKQNQAFKKLLEIAKNDKSDKLKLQAIYALRTSNNPEVLKFLEELIK